MKGVAGLTIGMLWGNVNRIAFVIEHYAIKFGPTVSQKELEKALHESGETPVQSNLHRMKARIEVIGDLRI